MSFDECDEMLTGGMFLKLDEDGDSVKVILAAEPKPIPSDYHGAARTQHAFPIITSEGLKVWAVGPTLYKELRDNWKGYSKNAILVTRKGKKNDKNTTYPIKVCPTPAKLSKQQNEITLDQINALLDNVKEFAEKKYADLT